MSNWEVVIGLEVHAQLATQSKLFSTAPTTFGAEPNTQACALDIALPGTLPVLNREAVNMAVKFGLAIGATVNTHNVFARKNYFYPDLPKGYQISQFDLPIVGTGHLDILLDDGSEKRIGITRAHLEEDAGKSLHESLPGTSGIDLNRAGTPLLEIVSEPDMRSAEEAVAYLKTLHQLVRYLDICDGNMQEGSFRCDVNISLRKSADSAFGTRAEIKNINSFRFVEQAIAFEIQRQANLLDNGEKIIQETRLFNPDLGVTRSMRQKEDAHDYRYFPDPDLLPVHVSQSTIDSIQRTLPELPHEKRQRYQHSLGLSAYDSAVLISHRDVAQYFEAVIAQAEGVEAKLVANWVTGELAAALNKHQLTIQSCPITPIQLAGLVARIHDQTISNSMGKQVFEALWDGANDADGVIESQGLKQISDPAEIEQIIQEIIDQHPNQLAQYRQGKDKLFGFFVGQAMKATRGKANPALINTLLKERLG